MKQTIIVSLLFLFFSLKGEAWTHIPQDSVMKSKTQGTLTGKSIKYCAVEQAGKIFMTFNGRAITADVNLSDGARLTPGGSIIKKDGSVKMLKKGDCVDKNDVVTGKAETQ